MIVEAKGATFEKALEAAAEAMLTQMGAEHATAKETRQLQVQQENRDDLVVAVLTAIIAECESEHFTPEQFHPMFLSGLLIRNNVKGTP